MENEFSELNHKEGLWNRHTENDGIEYVDLRHSWRCYRIKNNEFTEPPRLKRILNALKDVGGPQTKLF